MKLLLDSQAFVFLELYPERLPLTAQSALDDSGNVVYFSVVSALELQIKVNLNKITFSRPLRQIIDAALSAEWFQLRPITLDHIDALSTLPTVHRDPFDRLLIAQAIHEGLTLVTGDEMIAKYPVPTLWR